MRFKIAIPVAAIAASALFLIGLIAVVYYLLEVEVFEGENGGGWLVATVDLQSLVLWLLTLVLGCVVVYKVLKRKGR